MRQSQPVVFCRCSPGIHHGLRALARERGETVNQAAREILYEAIVSAGDVAVAAMQEGDRIEAEQLRREMEMETEKECCNEYE